MEVVGDFDVFEHVSEEKIFHDVWVIQILVAESLHKLDHDQFESLPWLLVKAFYRFLPDFEKYSHVCA